MKKDVLRKLDYKMRDHMFFGSVYDTIMKHGRYGGEPLSEKYNVLIGQKHRMLYYKKLKKRFLEDAVKERPWEKRAKKSNPGTIWVLWLQGMDKAPLLVRRCFDSLKEQLGDHRIVFLTEKNLHEYVVLPSYIEEKYRRGIISPASYSDLIRLELLVRHGGTWIDATVFCTDGTLLREVEDDPLFLYSFYYFEFSAEILRANTWLIVSRTNDNILSLTQKLLYEYWKVYNRQVDYFMIMIFMTMAMEYYRDEAEAMPIVSQVDAHILASYIYDRYDETKYRILKASTGFHKLSTRFEMDRAEQKGTFYDVIIRQGTESADTEDHTLLLVRGQGDTGSAEKVYEDLGNPERLPDHALG